MPNSRSQAFKDSLKVKQPIDHAKALAASQKKTSGNTPGEKGNIGRTKGGPTR